MQCGGRADAAQSMAMFHACHAAGLRHFDTAWIYTDGASETLLGQFARDHDILIATKVGYSGGAGRANLTAQFDTSRKRLGRDGVDLLYLHRFDPDTPLVETLTVFAEWQSRGLIARIGLSNFAAWQVMKAQAVAAALGTRIDAIQPMYSLVKRQAEVELLPMAAAGLARLAVELGTHPATLAVAWAKRHPAHPVPLISAREIGQLVPSLAAADYPMTTEIHARIAALYPAPPPATDRTEEA
jgi:aryl-alcohol dehydrogenase-like predicted oxidoreductase